MNSSQQKLSHFHKYYFNAVFKERDNDLKTQLLSTLCTINWKLHFGNFYCNRIESELLKIGRLNTVKSEKEINNGKVLHVASELYQIGGHTRLFESYLDIFDGFVNHLFLSRQSNQQLPSRIRQNKKIANIFVSQNESHLSRAKSLAEIWNNYDFVVLYIHPDDVIPIISFGMNPNDKLFYVNHADHCFWVGKNIINTCINTRPIGNEICKQYRGISKNKIIPLIRTEHFQKKKCGLEDNKVAFGSMTSLYKILPKGKKNFLTDIYELLDIHKDAIFHLIGISENDIVHFGYKSNLNNRLKLYGVIEQPQEILLKIDIYLEGYPYNSMTAMYDAIYAGACPVLMYEIDDINSYMENELSFQGILSHSKDKKEYLIHIEKLVGSVHERNTIRGKLFERLMKFNSIEYARNIFFSTIESTDFVQYNSIDISELSKQTYEFDVNQFRQKGSFSLMNFVDLDLFNKLNFTLKLKLICCFLYANRFSLKSIRLNLKLLKWK
jgi:hypothetical protein